MKKLLVMALLTLMLAVALLPAQVQAVDNDCWGQATAVFAQTGEMGKHASEQGNPRTGLKMLAEDLYGLGLIDAPTLWDLGAWVAAELGLEIDACLIEE